MGNTLNIRFKGFTDDWEQRKLDDEVGFYSGLTYTPTDIVENGGTLVLRSSNVKNNEIVMDDNVYVNSEVVNSENVQVGDIAVVVRNGSRTLIGKHAKIKENMPFTVIGAFMMGIRSEHSAFINALLSTQLFDKEIEKNMGATINQITGGMFKSMEFFFQKDAEQELIGKYFENLDNLITLHQRKCDETKEVKKFMLQKMFPKKGEKKPEIRFAGFTDDWEQRKLGEILEERVNKTSDFENNPLYSLTIENGITPKTDRYEREFLVKKEEKLFKIVKPGEFVTNPMNLRFGAVGYNTNGFNVSVSGYYDMFSIDDNKCSSFWNSYFKTPTILKKFDIVATGSLIEKRRVKYSTLKSLDFLMPATLDEKMLIAQYFTQLDNLITLHQHKCDEIKEIKKFMLQNMFPQKG